MSRPRNPCQYHSAGTHVFPGYFLETAPQFARSGSGGFSHAHGCSVIPHSVHAQMPHACPLRHSKSGWNTLPISLPSLYQIELASLILPSRSCQTQPPKSSQPRGPTCIRFQPSASSSAIRGVILSASVCRMSASPGKRIGGADVACGRSRFAPPRFRSRSFTR